MIDEVSIWNIVRTTAQIQNDMYRRLLTPYSANLIAYYQFNSTTGQYNELSGNGNNGTIIGFVTNITSTAPIPFFITASCSWNNTTTLTLGQSVPPQPSLHLQKKYFNRNYYNLCLWNRSIYI